MAIKQLAFLLLCPILTLAAGKGEILRHFTIYGSGREYCAWPSITRAANGDLLVLFCETEEHLGPDGRILLMRSADNGKTWQGPQIAYNTIIDDRECGITALRDGRLLMHLWSTHWREAPYAALAETSYERPVLQRWIKHVNQPAYANSSKLQKAWLSISSNNGTSWPEPLDGPDSVHGGIQLYDGSILVAGYRDHPHYCGIYISDSTATSWQEVATIHSPQPDSIRFGEPHVAQLKSGRVILMMRATMTKYDDQAKKCYLWESYSDDLGKTWVEPFVTPMWGFPPHLLVLKDGRLLCSYGYRRPPFGERACISQDGVHWSVEDEIVLRNDAVNGDLGYPASLELEPGTILTVYYQPDASDRSQRMKPPDPHRKKPAIQATAWKLPI
jgi:hypothetical protein